MSAGRRRNHLETRLLSARDIGNLTDSSLSPVLGRLDEVGRPLNAVIVRLRRREAQRASLRPTA